MFDHYITFRSLTSAQMGMFACRKRGILVTLVRAPQSVSYHGCAYSIKVAPNDIDQVILLFRLENISYEHVFRKKGRQIEEVFL